ncbi:MAG: hypothetical protein F4029_15850 [Gammaproteobacteria bacterium]|nr:hypothetical protein [Gammaproteobacteria bacterium]MXY57478.1 hypothetical protein [Gammaproteobacteria bacterium]MYF28745.1 hypothetical protein [Gammaproteobacteria bacterium]MYK45749.1 hypothetical protein [Gammaproteobacteria bacterium]MYK47691.1 hypothetical protein [Gammaproteobacteria bacterium]
MQTGRTQKQLTVARRILRLLKNDALIAAVAVLAVSFVAVFGVAVITWFTYRERYGVGFLEYLRIFL